MQKASLAPISESTEYRVIGEGTCGTVFGIPGEPRVYKKGADPEAIWKDFIQTNRVYNAGLWTREMLQREFPKLTIPRSPKCHGYWEKDSEQFWNEHLPHFPEDKRCQQSIFEADRILPVPFGVRAALLRLFFSDSKLRKEAVNNPDNDTCLIRPHMGENDPNQPYATSLRNFPLRLDMMEMPGLELDTTKLAEEMALGLAIVHWQAQLDGHSMEFVFGSSAAVDDSANLPCYAKKGPPVTMPKVKFLRRPIHLWMLDFDKAERIELTRADVIDRLVPAFVANDPYFPSLISSQRLWTCFAKAYQRASKAILEAREMQKDVIDLPDIFLRHAWRFWKAEVERKK